ncbi:RNA polymerase sigma factor, sigma-70 family [Singulisphaera sp. GP187]|uniref:RNA polymerase sigma factor n=1 Tax=Singulisphaera sp. GP187 TaxID=1882752 RepID=UPI00092A6469|nr:RNA polymerase sigma factor [Singulisphaera sp. GP187]SIO28611.1 RNA polymerase sigma factor, sigma-70 family [Singulisphaera sp. GP187]
MGRVPNGVSRLHLRTLFSVGVIAGLTDGQLLERFATHEGEAAELAFAAIVERHGPMVFRTCRGILGDDHEAMDAFQATFLVLLRKGNTLWVRDSLGPWLHRVACRASGRAKVNASRRRVLERGAAERGNREGSGITGDLALALHEEVDRLPHHYRVPVVLCDMEGRTYEEAARHLGCPVGTVRSRLARGRERLRGRLIRRGLAPSSGSLGLALSADAATAAMPANLVGSTIQLATRVLVGSTTTAGGISASILEITEGISKIMLISKLDCVFAGFLGAVGLAAIGAGVLAQQTPEVERPSAVRPRAGAEVTAKPLQVDAGSRPWVKSLPNGATLEVIGVSTLPSGPRSWWGPDGSPLAQPPCDPLTTGFATPANSIFGGDSISRVTVVRVSNLPTDSNHLCWMRESRCRREPARKDGKVVPGLSVVISEHRKDLANLTLHFQVAAEPWQVAETWDVRNPGSRSARQGSPIALWGRPISTKPGTTLTVTHEIKNSAVRLVAIDQKGQEHLSPEPGDSSLNGFSQLQAEFALNPEEFQKYQLQKRPFEQIEIPIIAIETKK